MQKMYRRLFQGTELASAESDEDISIAQVYQSFKDKLKNAINGAKEKTINLRLKTNNSLKRELAEPKI